MKDSKVEPKSKEVSPDKKGDGKKNEAIKPEEKIKEKKEIKIALAPGIKPPAGAASAIEKYKISKVKVEEEEEDDDESGEEESEDEEEELKEIKPAAKKPTEEKKDVK